MSGKIGERGFVARLRAQRPLGLDPIRAQQTEKSAPQIPIAPRAEPSRTDLAFLETAFVPKKIITAHAAHLAPALGDIAALAEKSRRLEPHFAAQYTRAIAGFYGTLGKLLAATPENSRTEVAAASIAGMKQLIGTLERGEHLVPALFAVIGQLDSGARLLAQDRLELSPADLRQLAPDAVERVRAFTSYLEGCEGIGAALTVLPNILEQIDRAAPKLNFASRTKLLDDAMTYFIDVSPRAGLDATIAGKARDQLATALLESPGEPLKALAGAKKTIREEQKPSRDALYKKFDDLIPEDFERGTPRFESFWKLRVAMFETLRANPVGPEALYQQIEQLYQQAIDARQAPLFELDVEALAEIIGKLAGSPLATPALEFFAKSDRIFQHSQAKTDRLIVAAGAKDLGDLAKKLIDARAYFSDSGSIRKLQGLNKSAELLDLLDPMMAMKVVFATGSNFYRANSVPALLETLAEHAQSLQVDRPMAALTELGERFNHLEDNIGDWPPGASIVNSVQLARAVALAMPKDAKDYNHKNEISSFLQETSALVPGYALERLVHADLIDRPGLLKLVDPDAKYRTPPKKYFHELLDLVWKRTSAPRPNLVEHARTAIAIAEKIGHMDGDPAIPFERIKKDFEAVITGKNGRNTPAAGGMVAVRVSQQPQSFEQFLKANPEIPMELAPTVATHFSPAQVAWLKERLQGSAKSRDSVRTLRDFTFACVDAGRLDLLELMRGANVPAKTVSRTITHMAGAYRLAGAGHVPFDLVAGALARREDPIAILDAARQAAAVASLKLPELENAKIDEAGLQTLMDNSAPVGGLLSHFGPDYHGELSVARGFRDNDLDYQAIRAPFVAALVDIAEGTWPKVKYESEVGQRMLRELSADQIAIWRSETVTAAKATGTPEELTQRTHALALLRGLEKVIPEHVTLGGELEYDRASLEGLRKERGALLEQLHSAEKGTPEHRTLSGQIGPINDRIAVIELQLALTDRLAEGAIDPTQLLVELRPLFGPASAAAGKLGPRVISDALTEVIDASRSIRIDAREGKHAVDEDSLNAMVGSHKSGCLNPTDDHYGFRRFGLAQGLVDANTKMLRTYDENGKMVYRAFLRVLHLESDKYTGPVLWIENPHNDGGGNSEDAQLLFKTAVNKAVAMNIPVAASYSNSWLINAADEQQLQNDSSLTAKVCVEQGNVAVFHSDALSNGTGRIDKNVEADGYWRISQWVSLVLPQKVEPAPAVEGERAPDTQELEVAEPILEEAEQRAAGQDPAAGDQAPVTAKEVGRMKRFADLIARLWKGE